VPGSGLGCGMRGGPKAGVFIGLGVRLADDR
jgi:hypothetical protein